MVTDQYQLRCPACAWQETVGPNRLLDRLRASGVLRRAKDPDESEIFELAQAVVSRWNCPECNHQGLTLVDAPNDDADADWGDGVACERCRAIIPAERVELFPNSKLCVKCQQSSERGDDSGAAEYCPRCGSVLQLARSRRDGISRYVMQCPACRR